MTTALDLSSAEGIQAGLDLTPIHRWLAFRVVSMDKAQGRLEIAAPAAGNAARSDGAGQAHGGAIATLIDTTATFACSVVMGHGVPTMNLRVDYLRPAAGPEMLATAIVRKAGRTASVVDVDVTSGGKLVAVGRAVLASAQG